MRPISIFDTTLRDGEQSPGASLGIEEKLLIARMLLQLNVDVIEAGFPISSPADFQSVQQIARLAGEDAIICGLSRAKVMDIDACADALADAVYPRIHTGLGVSEVHLREKLHLSHEDALMTIERAVRHARNRCAEVQFYAEDAARADRDFLVQTLERAIAAGARIVNIPDTTGYSTPEYFGGLIAYVREHTRGIEDVVISVHCHNDLGMATALSLAGVQAGAAQVECTINGIGERAGNTAMEEIVMALKVHAEDLGVHTNIHAQEFTKASKLVSSLTGFAVAPNKAIVGTNAFAHASGIHQDGVLKARSTYEIISPDEVGAQKSRIVLGARSGKAALRYRLSELGYTPTDKELSGIYERFLALADKKREIYDEDLESLMGEHTREQNARYTLESVQISCGFPLKPTATVTLKDAEGNLMTACRFGTGPIDAAYKAIDEIIPTQAELTEFNISSVSRGIDALGEVFIRIVDDEGNMYSGRGSDGDIVVSSTKAYLHALNKLLIETESSK